MQQIAGPAAPSPAGPLHATPTATASTAVPAASSNGMPNPIPPRPPPPASDTVAIRLHDDSLPALPLHPPTPSSAQSSPFLPLTPVGEPPRKLPPAAQPELAKHGPSTTPANSPPAHLKSGAKTMRPIAVTATGEGSQVAGGAAALGPGVAGPARTAGGPLEAARGVGGARKDGVAEGDARPRSRPSPTTAISIPATGAAASIPVRPPGYKPSSQAPAQAQFSAPVHKVHTPLSSAHPHPLPRQDDHFRSHAHHPHHASHREHHSPLSSAHSHSHSHSHPSSQPLPHSQQQQQQQHALPPPRSHHSQPHSQSKSPQAHTHPQPHAAHAYSQQKNPAPYPPASGSATTALPGVHVGAGIHPVQSSYGHHRRTPGSRSRSYFSQQPVPPINLPASGRGNPFGGPQNHVLGQPQTATLTSPVAHITSSDIRSNGHFHGQGLGQGPGEGIDNGNGIAYERRLGNGHSPGNGAGNVASASSSYMTTAPLNGFGGLPGMHTPLTPITAPATARPDRTFDPSAAGYSGSAPAAAGRLPTARFSPVSGGSGSARASRGSRGSHGEADGNGEGRGARASLLALATNGDVRGASGSAASVNNGDRAGSSFSGNGHGKGKQRDEREIHVNGDGDVEMDGRLDTGIIDIDSSNPPLDATERSSRARGKRPEVLASGSASRGGEVNDGASTPAAALDTIAREREAVAVAVVRGRGRGGDADVMRRDAAEGFEKRRSLRGRPGAGDEASSVVAGVSASGKGVRVGGGSKIGTGPGGVQRKKRKGDQDVPNQDFCSSCRGVGRFLCCDGCPRSFHFMCLEPPLRIDELPEEETWYCKKCRVDRGESGSASPTKEYTSIPGSGGALATVATFGNQLQPVVTTFKMLVKKLDEENPVQFRLPNEVRQYFAGVGADQRGNYMDVDEARLKIDKKGFQEERDSHKLKEGKTRTVACYVCGGSAFPVRQLATDPESVWRQIVGCDYCALYWHLDCLNPPLAAMPNSGRKWMCPNHAEQVMARRRQVKAGLEIVDVENRNTANNGNIDVVPNEENRKQLEYEDMMINKRKYRVPERIIHLDFWDRLKFGSGRNRVAPAKRKLHRSGSESSLTSLDSESADEPTSADLDAANLIMAIASARLVNPIPAAKASSSIANPPESTNIDTSADPQSTIPTSSVNANQADASAANTTAPVAAIAPSVTAVEAAPAAILESSEQIPATTVGTPMPATPVPKIKLTVGGVISA